MVGFSYFLEKTGAYGPNQFSYRKNRGCKDALALNVLQWLWWFAQGYKVGLYCSDVAGAFDKVSTEKFLAKLVHLGVRGKLLNFLSSWLESRDAIVIVDGSCSSKAVLRNMVYQGTVLGPPLWNVFFADARFPVGDKGFTDIFFADDLNCYKAFPSTTSNDSVYSELHTCQASLHEWGASNRVEFDQLKETFHVLDRRKPDGECFTVLGVVWDLKLRMDIECDEVAGRADNKLTSLLRLRSFYDLPSLVRFYKAQVLPMLEFPTRAVYHACNTNLAKLDRVQRRFLREVGLTTEQAFLGFNLAPLQTRRDVAGLGIVHRTVLGQGPPHFRKWFFPSQRARHSHYTRLQDSRHNKHLHDYLDGSHNELLRRSLLSLPKVYNGLPQSVVDAKSVATFQKKLTRLVRNKLNNGDDRWEQSLNLRQVSFF